MVALDSAFQLKGRVGLGNLTAEELLMRKSLSAVPVLAVLALGQAVGSAQTTPAAPKTPPAPQTSAPPAAPAPRRAPAPKPNPFGPQPGVTGARNPTDVKTILYYAQDALGLLRSPREVDWVISLEFWGTGTLSIDGKPCRLSSYRASVKYPPDPAGVGAATGLAGAAARPSPSKRVVLPAMRTDFNCASSGGKPGPRQVQVVAGKYAWNETAPGMNPTGAEGAATDRLLQLWTLVPESLVKAAVMAGAQTKADVLDGGMVVLTFPLPAPLDRATVKATVNPKVFRVDTNPSGQKFQYSHLIERSEARLDDTVIETTYAEYGDWNDADLQSMILLPRRLVQKKNGATTVDLTITKSHTYNPYVIMPVPESLAGSF